MNETLSRFLLALEAIGLLLPLSLLYGVLLSISPSASVPRWRTGSPK